jgi:cell pole-organizing protein PopZ
MVSERDDQHAEYDDAPDAEPESEPIWHAPDYDAATASEDAVAGEPAPGPKARRRSGEIDPRRLLSPRSDEAVQSAFNQLADIILSEQTRTLEDLVKDMMQPMLRHWLDDNLPVLVERLVREEIERVSRGRR